MKKRWFIYGVIGLLFGVFDFYFQIFVPGRIHLPVLEVLVIYGIWLVPLLPISFYEAKTSHSKKCSAFAGSFTWSLSILSYYLFLPVKLMLIGQASRQEMHISNYQEPWFWENIKSLFLGDVLGGILEWIGVAIVGGGLIGFLACVTFLFIQKRTGRELQT